MTRVKTFNLDYANFWFSSGRAWICFQFIRVDVILMQPSTVIPHTAEMVLKPSQLAFKIVQAVAMGKQELLREDLCKAITEQVG